MLRHDLCANFSLQQQQIILLPELFIHLLFDQFRSVVGGKLFFLVQIYDKNRTFPINVFEAVFCLKTQNGLICALKKFQSFPIICKSIILSIKFDQKIN